jgi:hypothetical protein
VTAETGWLQYAIKDPAVFLSTLYHWALLNYDFIPVKFRSTGQLLQLKGTVVRMINAHLNASHNQESISDEAVASVACLANANVGHCVPHHMILVN